MMKKKRKLVKAKTKKELKKVKNKEFNKQNFMIEYLRGLHFEFKEANSKYVK